MKQHQGLKITCLKKIVWCMGWIDASRLEVLAQPLLQNGHGRHRMHCLKRGMQCKL
ncbi:hypothetical protein [Nitrosomonas sp. HPC101]|uniref:hypothetical protein n=1 Tax=Nitrosomonas sp. HPC101 TaxID=1658667 RepID=UPI00136D0175|nr:hypothetical protein [Nitrosomonas sp. HPC101]